jgi:hypothetical protein
MFSPLNSAKICTIICVGLLTCLVAKAQESETYYRYFEVKLKPKVELEEQRNSLQSKGDYYQFHSSCEDRHSVIVAVRADYPKRIPAIEDELAVLFKKNMLSDKASSISIIKAPELQSYCR